MYSFNPKEKIWYIELYDHWNQNVPAIKATIDKLKAMGHKITYGKRREYE